MARKKNFGFAWLENRTWVFVQLVRKLNSGFTWFENRTWVLYGQKTKLRFCMVRKQNWGFMQLEKHFQFYNLVSIFMYCKLTGRKAQNT